MRQMIAARMDRAANFAGNNCMSKVIVFLLAILLFPLQASAGWSAAGAASTMKGYQDTERQRVQDEREQRALQRQELENERIRLENERAKADIAKKKQADNNASATVQAIIDRNPTLKAWQVLEPDKWAIAIRFDSFLMGLDEYKNVTMEDRFNDVAEIMSAYFQTKEAKQK